jgi:hypothetical protein
MIIGFVLVAVSIHVIKFKKTGDLSWYVRVYCHREPQLNKKRFYCNANITFPNNGPILAKESSGIDSPCRRPPLGWTSSVSVQHYNTSTCKLLFRIYSCTSLPYRNMPTVTINTDMYPWVRIPHLLGSAAYGTCL